MKLKKLAIGTLTTMLLTLTISIPAFAMDYSNYFWNNYSWVGWSHVTSGELVYAVQTMVNAVGYSPGTIDGQYGNNTQTAIAKYQSSQSLSSDGIVGPNTWSSLQGNLVYVGTSGGDEYDTFAPWSSKNFQMIYNGDAASWWFTCPDGSLHTIS